jgi:hypothetical protein
MEVVPSITDQRHRLIPWAGSPGFRHHFDVERRGPSPVFGVLEIIPIVQAHPPRGLFGLDSARGAAAVNFRDVPRVVALVFAVPRFTPRRAAGEGAEEGMVGLAWDGTITHGSHSCLVRFGVKACARVEGSGPLLLRQRRHRRRPPCPLWTGSGRLRAVAGRYRSGVPGELPEIAGK